MRYLKSESNGRSASNITAKTDELKEKYIYNVPSIFKTVFNVDGGAVVFKHSEILRKECLL